MRIFEKADQFTSAEELIRSWRQERAYQIGRALTGIGIVLGLVATAIDLQFMDRLLVYSDLVFLGGCFLSLVFTRTWREKPYFVWWPAYFGFWVSSMYSLYVTGGVQSPFLGLYLTLLFLAALIVQTEIKPPVILVFTAMNLVGWVWIQKNIPLPDPVALPPIFTAAILSLLCAAVVACALVFFKTEKDFALEVVRRYQDLRATKAELAREESANSAKSSFLANISHELRTPLGAILGYADLVLDPDTGTKDHPDYLETIRRNGRQLATLVDDLLDISKMEAGKIDLQPVPFRPRDLFEEVVADLRLSAEKKKLSLELVVDPAVPEWLVADSMRLKQILINMVGNAVKFTDIGSVTIQAAFRAEEKSKGRVSVRVIDTGRGITGEEQKKLFRPFTQADASVSRRYGGTGLGLHLSRKLAQLMGGDLELEGSQAGAGSVFHLQCLASIFEADKRFAVDRKSSEEVQRLDGIRVLVVDDTPDNQRLVSTYLRAAGATVACANDGFEAINESLTGRYDVVVMDVQMPVLDGLRATRLLRQKGFNRPIVALTAHAMNEDRERCRSAGYSSYLAKPVERRILVQTVGEIHLRSRLTPLNQIHHLWQ